MGDQLRLALLGKPKFERNGQPLPGLTSVKGQALSQTGEATEAKLFFGQALGLIDSLRRNLMIQN